MGVTKAGPESPSSKLRWIVLADDFTGLQAASSQFAVRGFRVHTTTDWRHPADEVAASTADVIGVDTASRWLPAAEAYQRVRQVAEFVKEAGVPFIYKQNDSTLRGNLGPELQALHDAFPGERILYSPACPSAGRQTVCGRQLLHGKLITPVTPDAAANLTTLQDWISHGSRLSSVSLGMQLFYDAAPAALLSQRAEDVLVSDASTDDQLEAMAAAGLEAGFRLFAGAVDLAGSLAVLAARSARLPTLIVVGSFEERTKVQVRQLLAAKPVAVARSVSEGGQPGEGRTLAAQAGEVADQVRSSLGRGDDTLLLAHQLLDSSRAASEAGAKGPTEQEARRGIETLKEVVRRVIGSPLPPLGGIVVTGGDTAHAIVSEVLGATRFRIVGRVFSAVVAIVPEDGLLPGLPVITKSGSWGPDDALTRAVDFLPGLNTGRA